MTHGSLFSGIGGFELAAQWVGWQNKWSCEKDIQAKKVLRKNFGNDHLIYDDITTLKNPPYVDIISGGFPCQPVSRAGKRRGRNDDRWLWPDMLRIINAVKPKWIVGENVDGLQDVEFEAVCVDLEAAGYEVWSVSFSAASLGLQTMERHWWIIASANSFRPERLREKSLQDITLLSRQYEGGNTGTGDGWDISKSRFCRVSERVSGKLDKAGRERLKQLGNAIPPQAAYMIFAHINQLHIEYEKQDTL